MKSKFKLDCIGCTPAHVTFRVIDGEHANCGIVTVRREDTGLFLGYWTGDILWNGLKPDGLILQERE